MTYETAWEIILVSNIVSAAIAQTGFVVLYARKSPWRSHFVGKALFAKSGTLALALLLTVTNMLFPAYPYQLEVSTLAMVLVNLSIIGQLIALLAQVYPDRVPRRLRHRLGADHRSHL